LAPSSRRVVGYAVRELVAVSSIGKQAAKGPDDRIHGLTAEHGQAIDQHHFAPGPGGGQRGRGAGDARTDNADIRCDPSGSGVSLASNDFRICCWWSIHFRFHSLMPLCIQRHLQIR